MSPIQQSVDDTSIGSNKPTLSRRTVLFALGASHLFITPGITWAFNQTSAEGVEPQPFFAHVKRIIKAMRQAGEPIAASDEQELLALSDVLSTESVKAADEILNRYVLIKTALDERGMAFGSLGGAEPRLVEQGWRTFLLRVSNVHNVASTLDLYSDEFTVNTDDITPGPGGLALRDGVTVDNTWNTITRAVMPEDVAARSLSYDFFVKPPLDRALSGIGLEYQIIQLFSRDHGKRTAYFYIYSDAAPIEQFERKRGVEAKFICSPSRDITFDIKDWNGEPVTASVIIRDEQNRLYPAIAQRMEPDFDFQPQVYRADGETVRLPNGKYDVTFWRGPEYLKQTQEFVVGGDKGRKKLKARLKRWINAADLGWYPGDTHIHAAGCSHYEYPTMGVAPETIIRHVRGEALTFGDVLTWGPGYYYQKQFFTGRVHDPSNGHGHQHHQKFYKATLKPKQAAGDKDSAIRYDIEVSGFPSSHSGHLVLLRLKEHDFPGAERIEDWPSWQLPILKWAKDQGAIVGYAHSGAGMFAESEVLPNYDMPVFNNAGAYEFFVDLVHDAVDFVSGGEYPPATELNFWYHVLNCGFRPTMVGETDFPCLSDDRVGNGRTYVGLDEKPKGDAGFTAWTNGIKAGRVYFGDGRSHFIDCEISGRRLGGDDVVLSEPSEVTLSAKVAAYLNETPIPADEDSLTPKYLYWHLERARIGDTRQVLLEVIVNGQPVEQLAITADGVLRDYALTLPIKESSWVAMRILPSGHTNPFHIQVKNQPVRASRKSAEWCLACIDTVWARVSHRIRETERADAKAAYSYARRVFRQIRDESPKA